MQKTNKLCHHAPESSNTLPSHDHGVSDLGTVFLGNCMFQQIELHDADFKG